MRGENMRAKEKDNEGEADLNLSKAKDKHQPHLFPFVCLSVDKSLM